MRDAANPGAESILQVTSSDPNLKSSSWGTAFVVGRAGTTAYLVTCAHVIRDICGAGQDQMGCPVRVGSGQARVIACGSPDGPDDLAVLEADLPHRVAPVRLGFSGESGRACRVRGFDQVGGLSLYRLRSIDGRLGQRIGLQRLGEQQLQAWQLEMSEELRPGFSGSPVIDTITDDAIGIAAISLKGGGSGIAISAEVVLRVWPEGQRYLDRPRLKHRDLDVVWVPGGQFTMGTTEREARALAEAEGRTEFERETPRGLVQTRGYYIARFPITSAQYARFVEATGRQVPHRSDDLSQPYNWDAGTRRFPQGTDDLPVVLVSWQDAREYCRWVGGRLPTEAEWEKAARGPVDTREWPWGDDWDPSRCNTIEGGRLAPTPVGLYSPAGDSPYGAADMSGNVWEWCSSLVSSYPYVADDGRENAAALGDRVIRGGAWGNNRFLARCAYRGWARPDGGFTIGFRVAFARESVELD